MNTTSKQDSRNPNYRHGGHGTSEYTAWQNMKARCYNKNRLQYVDYGGRGITVCDEWLNSFPKFLKDMGNKPSQLHTLDRIDNNKGYNPDNCKWSTRTEQSVNKRSERNETGFKGVSKNHNNWAAHISQDNKNIYLGTYKTTEEPALAYDAAAIQLWNGNCELNFLGESV